MADLPDHHDDALEGPQVRGESPRGRAAHECGFEAVQGGSIEPGLPSGPAGAAQARRAVLLPRLIPAAGGFARHAQLANDISLTLASGKQQSRPLSSRFQSGEIASSAKGGRHGGSVAHPSANVTIL